MRASDGETEDQAYKNGVNHVRHCLELWVSGVKKIYRELPDQGMSTQSVLEQYTMKNAANYGYSPNQNSLGTSIALAMGGAKALYVDYGRHYQALKENQMYLAIGLHALQDSFSPGAYAA